MSRRRAQGGKINFNVKVAGVGENCAVAHRDEVLLAQYLAAASDGDEYVAAGSGLQRWHYLEALHSRFERAQRVNLADDHRGAKPLARSAIPLPVQP